MKIFGVGMGKVTNIYSKNKDNIQKKNNTLGKDSVEISSIGKSLSDCSTDESYKVSDKKVQQIKKEIENNNYSVDTDLVAQKIMDHIKGREF